MQNMNEFQERRSNSMQVERARPMMMPGNEGNVALLGQSNILLARYVDYGLLLFAHCVLEQPHKGISYSVISPLGAFLFVVICQKLF